MIARGTLAPATTIMELDECGLDIDWFFTDGENIGFTASGGGQLPKPVKQSRENAEMLICFFHELPATRNYTINVNLKEILPDGNPNELYLSDFAAMASRGLYSFDKTILERPFDGNYYLVAKPADPLKLSELPSNVIKLLSETTITKSLYDSEFINIDNFI